MSIPAAYIAVILIWSTTPLAIQWSSLGAGFSFAVMARMVIGLVLAGLLLAVWRIGLPLHRRARMSYLVSGLGLFGAMLCTYWGAQFISSGLVSVLFGLAPLVTSVLAAFWLGERGLEPFKLAGIGLGLIGLVVVFGAQLSNDTHHAAYGVASLVLAVLIYSAGLVWMKRIGDDSPPLATTTGTLIVALPLFIAAWWLADGSVPADMPLRAEAAIVYLGVFGSVLGFALYYYIVKHVEAGKVALITLTTPVFALLLGAWLNGEVVPPRVWLGAGCIGLGLALHQKSALSGAFNAARLKSTQG
jgi:drug/metabolite transporter (DMT)-like permease